MKSRVFVMRSALILLTTVAWTLIGSVADTLAKSHMVKKQLVVKVGVYNYAGVARLQLRVGVRQAAALLAEANVRIAWAEYSGRRLSVPSGIPAPDFSVRILNASRLRRVRQISRAELMGEAFISWKAVETVPGRIANVFYDRVKHVSTLWDMFPGQVLGDAMAHELGHLLLGPQHSRRGIMKADWTLQDLASSSRGKLQFSREQAEALQRAARFLQRTASVTRFLACASPPATLGWRVGGGAVSSPAGRHGPNVKQLKGEEALCYESFN